MTRSTTLALVGIRREIDGETHLDNINLSLNSGSINVLLGPTRSGKTSLLRLMAGLDQPDSGKILFNREDVSGWSVKKRNVAMVYQQFINYPSLNVFENIASPLRVADKKWGRDAIAERVGEVASLLKIDALLDRMPTELSGGQQQRLALARALAKRASLVLLDEPLANLDYKLRESLREELPRLFAQTGAILVYATTEPAEALLLGGRCVSLSQGHVTQSGPVLDCFRNPNSRVTAEIYSDPPLNVINVDLKDRIIDLQDEALMALPKAVRSLANGQYTLAFRPMDLRIAQMSDRDMALQTCCLFADITGSESLIHTRFRGQDWISQNQGIHSPSADSPLTLYLDPADTFLFNSRGKTLFSPAQHGQN